MQCLQFGISKWRVEVTFFLSPIIGLQVGLKCQAQDGFPIVFNLALAPISLIQFRVVIAYKTIRVSLWEKIKSVVQKLTFATNWRRHRDLLKYAVLNDASPNISVGKDSYMRQ